MGELAPVGQREVDVGQREERAVAGGRRRMRGPRLLVARVRSKASSNEVRRWIAALKSARPM